MKLLSLTEFQKMACLSDKAMMWLLRKGGLNCQINAEGSVQIDIDSTSTAELVQAIRKERKAVFEEFQPILSEKCGKVVSTRLEAVMNEAISIFLGQIEDKPE